MNEVRNILASVDISRDGVRMAFYDRSLSECVAVTKDDGGELISWEELCPDNILSKKTHFGKKALSDVLRKCLGCLHLSDPVAQIKALAVTHDTGDGNIQNEAEEALIDMGFAPDMLAFPDHRECFFAYAYHGSASLYERGAMLVEIGKTSVSGQILKEDRSARPYRNEIKEIKSSDIPEGNGRDEALAEYLSRAFEANDTSALYIASDEDIRSYSEYTMKALKASGRRVFAGGSLFAKGAVCMLLSDLETHGLSGRYLAGGGRAAGTLFLAVTDGDREGKAVLVKEGDRRGRIGRSITVLLPEGVTQVSVGVSHRGGRERYIGFKLRDEDDASLPRYYTIDAVTDNTEETELIATDRGFGDYAVPSGEKIKRTVSFGEDGDMLPGAPVPVLKRYKEQGKYTASADGRTLGSLYEIVYCLEKFPLLFLDELKDGGLRGHIERCFGVAAGDGSGDTIRRMAEVLFCEAGYPARQKRSRIISRTERVRDLTGIPLIMERAGELLAAGCPLKAGKCYEAAYKSSESMKANDEEKAELLFGIGTSRARMLLFNEAYEYFTRSYVTKKREKTALSALRALYLSVPKEKYLTVAAKDGWGRDLITRAAGEADAARQEKKASNGDKNAILSRVHRMMTD